MTSQKADLLKIIFINSDVIFVINFLLVSLIVM